MTTDETTDEIVFDDDPAVFKRPYKVFPSKHIKRIRLALVGSDITRWADMFCVGVDLCKAWEADPGSKRHRECGGPAGRLMGIAEKMAEGRKSALIRHAALGNLRPGAGESKQQDAGENA